MKSLSQVQKGFATYPTSTHCVVSGVSNINSMWKRGTPGDYGLEWFVLKSPAMKEDYFHWQLYYWLKRRLSDFDSYAVRNLANSIFRIHSSELAPGIDHNSVLEFPEPFKPPYSYAPLWDWFRKKVIEDNSCCILGGNDHEFGPPVPGQILEIPAYPRNHPEYKNAVFTCDSFDGHITVFLPATGQRLRYPSRDGQEPVASFDAPELVDLKITDRQDSKPDGERGKHLSWILRSLTVLKPFEVVLGGGDPTEDIRTFIDTVIELSFNRISVSTSVRNPKNLLESGVLHLLKTVAFSTQNPEEAADWCNRTIYSHKEWCSSVIGPTYVVHYVLGLNDIKHLEKYLNTLDKKCNGKGRVVLLDWKNTGCAASCKPYSTEGWQNIVRNFSESSLEITVDSFLAQKLDVLSSEVFSLPYESGDGRFSMYVDAVTGTAAPHSGSPGFTTVLDAESGNEDFLKKAWNEIVACSISNVRGKR